MGLSLNSWRPKSCYLASPRVSCGAPGPIERLIGAYSHHLPPEKTII